MKNDHTQTILYLDVKNVLRYRYVKFQPNLIFSSPQMATESAAEEKQKEKKKQAKKKSWKAHKGSSWRTGCPNDQIP